MKPVIAVLFLGLAACASTPEPRIVTKEVLVPISQPCQVTPPAKPAFPDTKEALLAAKTVFEQVQLLLAGRALRDPFIEAQAKALGVCTSP